MAGTSITGVNCRLAVYPAQSAGTGVAVRCKSALHWPALRPRIGLLTHRFEDLNLVCQQWGGTLAGSSCVSSHPIDIVL